MRRLGSAEEGKEEGLAEGGNRMWSVKKWRRGSGWKREGEKYEKMLRFER